MKTVGLCSEPAEEVVRIREKIEDGSESEEMNAQEERAYQSEDVKESTDRSDEYLTYPQATSN